MNAEEILQRLKDGKDREDGLYEILETEPLPDWLEDHPTAKKENGDSVKYLSIGRIDYLLRNIFEAHWLEITGVHKNNHTITVSVRLFYIHPETKKAIHQDGIGSAMLHGAIETASALAESIAKKVAAKKIGKIFGRDLSRDYGDAKAVKSKEPESERLNTPVFERIEKQLRNCKSLDQVNNVFKAVKKWVGEGQLTEAQVEELTRIANELASTNDE